MNDLNLLQKLIARWMAKSPLLFKVISWIGLIGAFVSGFTMLLTQLGITLSPTLLSLENKVILYVGIAVAIVSKLTVATPIATNKVLNNIASGTKPEVAKQGV